MKDFDESHKVNFGTINTENSLKYIQIALSILWEEEVKSGLDKVAGSYTYEELIGTLLHAEASELERRELEQELDEVIERRNATL